MTPTPVPITNFTQFPSALTSAMSADPVIVVVLAFAAIAGLAFYMRHKAAKVVR